MADLLLSSGPFQPLYRGRGRASEETRYRPSAHPVASIHDRSSRSDLLVRDVAHITHGVLAPVTVLDATTSLIRSPSQAIRDLLRHVHLDQFSAKRRCPSSSHWS